MGGRVYGTVVHGEGEGKATGYPTANLNLAADVERPQPGIYACWVNWNGQRYPGALVSGVHWEGNAPRLEVHLLDFAGELYGEQLEVEVLAKIRDIIVQPDPVSLQQRIAQDLAVARQLLGI